MAGISSEEIKGQDSTLAMSTQETKEKEEGNVSVAAVLIILFICHIAICGYLRGPCGMDRTQLLRYSPSSRT